MDTNAQKALNITYLNDTDLDALMRTYVEVQGTIMAQALSVRLKNTDITGEVVKGGTVTARRLKTAVSQVYGTARAAGEGNNLQNNGVDIKIDTNREIVEEIEYKDEVKYGIPALIDKRKNNHAMAMMAELDRAYFRALQSAANIYDSSALTTVEDKLIGLIQELESVVNENVDIVDRSLMVLTVSPAVYDAALKYTNTLNNPDGVSVRMFHGVEMISAPRQEFDAIIQVRGSVAQPVTVSPYKAERIPLSDATAVELFYYYGTKAVMSDLIYATAITGNISV